MDANRMEEPYFGFSRKNNSSSRLNLEDDSLPNRIEEDEYDALNDETFGIGADDGDWEEGHDKFAETVIKKKRVALVSSILDNTMFESDDTQHEIISKSISQLGLEDDLDDPAIMTIGRSRNAWPIEQSFRSSPPPPAIIDTELCGSPSAHSIWSANHSATLNNDSNIGTLLKSISQTSPAYRQSPLPLSPVPSNIFPGSLQAWTLEEIEERMIPSTDSNPSGKSWIHSYGSGKNVGTHHFNPAFVDKFHGNGTNEATALRNNAILTLDDVENEILAKADAIKDKYIEKMAQLYSTDPLGNKTNVLQNQQSPVPFMPIHTPVEEKSEEFAWMSELFRTHSMNSHNNSQSYQKQLQQTQIVHPHVPDPETIMKMTPFECYKACQKSAQDVSAPTLAQAQAMTNFHMASSIFPKVNARRMPIPHDERFNNYHFQGPRPYFCPTSVLNPQTILPVLPRRTIHHPLLPNGIPPVFWPYDMDPECFNPKFYCRKPCYGGYFGVHRRLPTCPDDYSNLMTQSEKEWLTRINLMLTNSDNPYVEDYYNSTLLLRKCTREALKNNKNKDGPKLLLPEKAKTETKVYVPAQFEGSLGKLQAVSVNFPRKVLDITVSRPLEDDEGRVVTNQSLLKYRRLLIDIENMYSCLLEIDDEEKRVLALPDDAHMPHKKKICMLIDKVFTGLGCKNVMVDDTFQNIMTVRKGRNLGMRAFEIFSLDYKLSYLAALFFCFATVLRKDQNDMVLLRYSDMLISFIKSLALSELVELGESLENLPKTGTVILPLFVREKSNYITAFKYRLGSSVVCCMLERAEEIYKSSELIDSEIQARWAKVVLHIADILCTLPDVLITPPLEIHSQLLTHFQRFAVDRDKFEVLKEKVKIFELSL